jgi:hypothetical protein
MRIIDESLIPVGDAAYFKQGTWTHLQKAYKEAIDALARCIIKSYDPTKVYILYGCVATGTDPGARTFTAGAVYYAGEVYLVPSASFTTTGSNVAIANISEVFNTTDYSVDPQTTPGGASISLHTIRTIVITAGTAGTGDVPDFSLWLGNGNAHKDAYTDITSTVTLNTAVWNGFSGCQVLRWEDGTVSVKCILSHSATVSAGTGILTGLPIPSYPGGQVETLCDDEVGTITFHRCLLGFGSGTLVLREAISTTNKLAYISFTYKL